MDHFSELYYLKHVLGPEDSDRSRTANPRIKAPIWLAPLLVVFALYGATFTIGLLVSNHAENTFAQNVERVR